MALCCSTTPSGAPRSIYGFYRYPSSSPSTDRRRPPPFVKGPAATKTTIETTVGVENDTEAVGASLWNILLEQEQEEEIVFDEKCSLDETSSSSSSSWSATTSRLSLSSIDSTESGDVDDASTNAEVLGSLELPEVAPVWEESKLSSPSPKKERRSTQVKVDGIIHDLKEDMKRLSRGLESAFHPNDEYGESSLLLLGEEDQPVQNPVNLEMPAPGKQFEKGNHQEEPQPFHEKNIRVEEEDDTNSIGGLSLQELQNMLKDADLKRFLDDTADADNENDGDVTLLMNPESRQPTQRTVEAHSTEDNFLLSSNSSPEPTGSAITLPVHSALNPQDDTDTVFPDSEPTKPASITKSFKERKNEASLCCEHDPREEMCVMDAAAELLGIDLLGFTQCVTWKDNSLVSANRPIVHSSTSSNTITPQEDSSTRPLGSVNLLCDTPSSFQSYFTNMKRQLRQSSSFWIPVATCALASMATRGIGGSMAVSPSTGSIIFLER